MAVDVSGYIIPKEEWGGLYKAAETLQVRRQHEAQLAMQQQRLQQSELARKQAAANFLHNYLDKEHYLTGTAADPMISHQLEEAMNQGAALAAKGTDSATIMMTLNPLVQRIADYSTRAKAISKQVDDTIAKMKENKYEGYDYAKLKDEALHNAFYDVDDKGNYQLNPYKADPATNWALKTIQDNPEKVTNSAGVDQYAKEAKMNKTLDDNSYYTPSGTLTRQKVHLISPDYLVPEREDIQDQKRKIIGNRITGFVPKHDIAIEKDQPLFHDFLDATGKKTRSPVRVLDEGIFDSLPPGIHDYLIGQVRQHLKEYEDQTGEQIPLNSPKAKLVARALAYNELNVATRKGATVENADIYNKPSSYEIRYNVGDTPQALKTIQDQAMARKGGGFLNAMGGILTNNPDYVNGDIVSVNGKNMIDVTPVFPRGGIKKGSGENVNYKKVYWDPRSRELHVNEEWKNKYGETEENTETLSEKELLPFVYRIAEANGVPRTSVKPFFEKLGFKNGVIPSADQSAADRINAKEASDKEEEQNRLNRDLQEFKTSKDLDKLDNWKGKQTREGVIDEISALGMFNKSKYYLKFANGKDKYLKDEDALIKYLQSKPEEQPKQEVKAPEKKKESDEERFNRLSSKYHH